MGERRFKISYIKKPFAKRSLISLPVAVVALICLVVSLRLSVRLEGNGGLNVGAWGLSSLLFAITGLVYGGLSFTEKEKNYNLAKAGIVISSLLILFWLCMLIVGLLS